MQKTGPRFVKAVDDVSFTLEQGKVLVLAGESGSGKTTVARLILRAIEPDEGSKIFFEGEDISQLSGGKLRDFRVAVHMVYQDPYASFNPRWKVLDIVMEPLTIHDGANTKEAKIAKAMTALRDVRLEPAERFASEFPRSLSGGQRQRVALARAIVLRPKIIVADEPVSMLDVSVRGEILGLMQTMRERFNISFIYITHDLSTARYVGDDLAIMKSGKIVEIGPIDRVISDPQNPYTRELINAIPEISEQLHK